MTKKLISAFANGIKVCADIRPSVEYLKQLAEVHPEIRDRTAELVSKLEYHDNLCQAGISIAEQMGGRQ